MRSFGSNAQLKGTMVMPGINSFAPTKSTGRLIKLGNEAALSDTLATDSPQSLDAHLTMGNGALDEMMVSRRPFVVQLILSIPA
jgi:hypothetical protein